MRDTRGCVPPGSAPHRLPLLRNTRSRSPRSRIGRYRDLYRASRVRSSWIRFARRAISGLTNFTRLRQLYDQAAAMDPSRRDAFLVEACQGDAAMLAELRGMVTPRYDTFLGQQAPAPPTSDPAPAAQNSPLIGAYRVLRD